MIEEFYEDLERNPKEALFCMSAAVHKVPHSKSNDEELDDGGKVNIRLHNHPESMIALKNLKAAYIVACTKCGTSTARDFPDGKSSPPSVCVMHGCKSRSFNPIRSSARPIDFQKIRIQELLKFEHHEEGRVPRTLECELIEDLVDLCIPGDVVTVTGKSKGRNQGLYYLYLEGISVKNSKSQSESENLQDTENVTKPTDLLDLYSFSQRDLEFICKFSSEYGPDVFRLILQSICPSIYGHELIKAGITLALFGGVRKHSMDQNKVPVRGDIHVIIVGTSVGFVCNSVDAMCSILGDPGLGKSQLLQAAASVSPRGIYVCGNATTNAGLTVAVVKDSMTGDYAFEAGAMVLADRGLCCIDEFDKMSAEHQCVSVAKAGLVASLSAQTTVLAAANPVGGHYNRAKTVNENLKINSALLSRFDLVFILLDRPDELHDKRAEHIMSVNYGCDSGWNSGGQSLFPKNSDFVPLPSPLLRKYVAYARTYVFPRMSREAAKILQEFYLRLRDRSTSADGTPVTARQLESLVRLAQARARVDLREEITVDDAKWRDEYQKEAKRFLSALNKQSELEQKDCFSISEIFGLADRIGLRVPDVDTFVENLNLVSSSSYSSSRSTH
ncbi:hypothetical protein L1987_81628 [Smallanthus sonchifolius]|uniref:Uncharacterized protein n=1 Tax=Smallanthus sonchifolius TaxID=185202 RepID=A0ACB8YSK3_9ASTR|nr:hypothetical protein L1987_81628 [Smallanthus sonchifolius]